MSQSSKLVTLHNDRDCKREQSEDYAVSGATVSCSQGTRDVQIVFPDRGYIAGYGETGLDIDTSAASNFSAAFGLCSCTREQCCPSLVDRWVESEKRQTINGGHPLLVKSMLVCTKGGVIGFKNSGQNT